MSFQITCPNCGPRDDSEFRYGGQIVPPAPAPASTSEAVGQRSFVSNLPVPQRERWFHRFGCRRWLVAERNTQTNEVLATGWLE